MTTQHNRIPAIDGLRGVAVLIVVLSHLPFSWRGIGGSGEDTPAYPAALQDALGYGRFGVNLFLVISGFCIHLAWARRGDLAASLDIRAFWRRRLQRLYPPYLLVVIGSVAMVLVGQRLGGVPGSSGVADLALPVLSLVLLVQNATGASWVVGNGPLWTLALEEQLYALYFPLLRIRKRWGWRVVLPFAFAATVAWRLSELAIGGELGRGVWSLLGPAHWFDWALGAYAVEGHLGLSTPPRWTTNPLAAAGALAVGLGWLVWAPLESRGLVDLIGELIAAFGFFLLVRAAVVGRWYERPRAWLPALGTISYSVYLVHGPLMIAVKRALAFTGSVWFLSAARLSAAIVGGLVFYLLVERRFLLRARSQVDHRVVPAVT